MDSVFEFIKSLNIGNKSVVVACSGGPDSMMLLDILHKLNYKVICAHVNHKFRKESDDEYIFLEDYCKNNNIIFEGVEFNDYNGGNFENAAREFRYNFFESVLRKYNTDFLFTAHHGDDLMETILMRIMRGSSLKGYCGFNKVTKKYDYKIIRPLIYLTKDNILEYLIENNIPYVIDKTNMSLDYTRNRFRHKALPFFKAEDKDAHLKFLEYSEKMFETYDFIDRLANSTLEKIYANNKLDLIEFKKLDYYLQREVVFKLFRIIYVDDLYVITENHVQELFKLFESNKPNVLLEFPHNLKVIKEYNYVLFTKEYENIGEYSYELKNGLELFDYKFEFLDNIDDNSNSVIRLNSKDIKLPLIVRNKKDGDRILIKNMSNSKKVKDIFIDSKLSFDERKKQPVVVDQSGVIVWIPGLKKSNLDIPNNNSCDIIVKYERKV